MHTYYKNILFSLFFFVMGAPLLAQSQLIGPYRPLPANKYYKQVDNLIVFLDRSASMSEVYIGMDKFAFSKSVLKGLQHTISDFEFNSALRTFGIREAISTNGLMEAKGKTAAIFLSDGKGSTGKALVAAQNLKRRYGDNICIHGVLAGNHPPGRKLIQQISNLGGCGVFETINQLSYPENMQRFVQQTLVASNTIATRSKPVESKPMESPKSSSPPQLGPLDDGWATASIAYPTGVESSSTVKIEKTFPKRAILGESFRYRIKVTNLTTLAIENVNVVERIPRTFEITQSTPEIYDSDDSRVAWVLGKLEPHESREIFVEGRASTKQAVPCCTNVNFNLPDLCLSTDVIEPAIAHAISTPPQHLVCDTMPLSYEVNNTGQTNLKEVWVKILLPRGARHADGNTQEIVKNIGSLAAGETRRGQEMIFLESPGTYKFDSSVQATSIHPYQNMSFTQSTSRSPSLSQGISAEASVVSTRAVQPVLALKVMPKRDVQFIGRVVGYEIRVMNTGDAEAQSTMVEASIPEVTTFNAASTDGTVSRNTVRWNLGTLGPGESRRMAVDLNGLKAGTARTLVKASGNCCEPVTAEAVTQIVGIPALLVEVIDKEDPIELFDEVIYQIRITNQGSAEATKVQVSAKLEQMSLIEGSGYSIPQEREGGTISFDMIPVLPPKVQVSWELRVRANKVGDQRFQVTVESFEMARPVIETEATQIY